MSVPQVARKIVTAIPGPKSEALKAEHTRYVSAGVGQGMPVFAETASGSTITDVDGNRFIDLASGIAVTGVGNCAPEVVAAVQEEVAKLTHTNFATTPVRQLHRGVQEARRTHSGRLCQEERTGQLRRRSR